MKSKNIKGLVGGFVLMGGLNPGPFPPLNPVVHKGKEHSTINCFSSELVVICMTIFLHNAVLQIYHASCLHEILSRWVKNLQSYRKKTNR